MQIPCCTNSDLRLKIIVCFYASAHRASEYRSGLDYIRIAGSLGFDYAITSDLPDNLSEGFNDELGLNILQVRQGCSSQSELYTSGDFQESRTWLKKVFKYISSRFGNLSLIWICNPAQPWLPIQYFLQSTQFLIWGPVGGGETLLGKRLQWTTKAFIHEIIREILQNKGLLIMKLMCNPRRKKHILVFSRTPASYDLLDKYGIESEMIPEIPSPIAEKKLTKRCSLNPIFIWVGRDAPRKNLAGAIQCFNRFLLPRFPLSRLEIYGVLPSDSSPISKSIIYHGWVNTVPFHKYRDAGVLLFSSHREGFPSSVIEAIENGLLVISTSVGALPFLSNQPNYMPVSHDFFSYSRLKLAIEDDIVAEKICKHLTTESLTLQAIDFTKSISCSIINRCIRPLDP